MQFPLRLLIVIVEIKPTHADYVTTKRNIQDSTDEFCGPREAAKSPTGDMPAWSRRANDFGDCRKQLFMGDIFPAEDVALPRPSALKGGEMSGNNIIDVNHI